MIQERLSPACSAFARRSARSMLPFITRHNHHLHSCHMCRSGVSSVRRSRDQADIAMPFVAAFMIMTNRQQARVFRPVRRSSAAYKQRSNRSVSPASQPTAQSSADNLRPAPAGRTGAVGRNSGQVIGIISAAALSFMVQEPSGIIA